MKVTIEYQFDEENKPHFWAVTKFPDGNKEFSGGDSWDAARERHIEKLRLMPHRINPPVIPQPEEIEL